MSNGIVSLGEHRADEVRDAEKVWHLRAQVFEHVKAIEELCEQMFELPHVYGICPEEVADHLDGIETMLTPADVAPGDDDPPKPGDENYPAWRRWLVIRDAKP
ncbi:MAG: hypothetical protein WAU49_05135 [Steroidobacteraceae bacterium]